MDADPLADAREALLQLLSLDVSFGMTSAELMGPEPLMVVTGGGIATRARESVERADACVSVGPASVAAGGTGRDAAVEESEASTRPVGAESEREEMHRLECTVGELSETNDRIMAQNIALLADLEAAQRAVRELRADKDALALQLKRALTSASS